MNPKDRYGPIPRDSNPLKRQCRLLQCWYRVEVLKINECGPWRIGDRVVGSSLVDGETSGANFISPEAFAYARQRVADKAHTIGMTIDEYRLFNNMLSSMPMCFNLFSEFRTAVQAGHANCNEILAAIFNSSPISRSEEVVVEMIPQPPSEYINDKTAWDAAIFYVDANGQKGLASIETKYTDKLGTNRASKEGLKHQLSRKLGVFTEDGFKWYAERGFDQIARNLLLTLAYADKHCLAHARNYVLSPAEDKEAPQAVAQLKDRLAPDYKGSIELLPLETVVDRGLRHADEFFAVHLRRFRQRYLDFSQTSHL